VNRTDYYNEMKRLARQIRADYGFSGQRILRSDLRRIYRHLGIRIDLWPHKFKKLRGAYFYDDLGATVMLQRGLPEDPMVFTMAHELKHHLADRDRGMIYCDPSNQNEMIEIGAEVFAAEFIFPEEDFRRSMVERRIGLGRCRAEDLVHLKHETRTTLSYAGLVKRAEFLGYAAPGSLANVRWRDLDERLYGEPRYKLILRRRALA
jgi:Zn-dependent peptidase ImmA (M78 family)